MKKYEVGIITVSDKGAAGTREDLSGPTIAKIIEGYVEFKVKKTAIVPDEQGLLETTLCRMADEDGINLILTTGGTGFSLRDITPEATLAVSDRRVPGIPEAIRAFSLKITGRAMLSRAEAGLRGQTLIVNLPGSPKAITETLEYILPHILHGLDILLANDSDCART